MPRDSAKPQRSLLLDTATYMSGQIGILLFSLLTFPIFTRVLPTSEYGVLSLVNNTLNLAVMVFGLGLPNAVVRFLPEKLRTDGPDGALSFRTSHLAAAAAISLAGAGVLLLARLFVPESSSFSRLFTVLGAVIPLLIGRNVANIILEFFRVGQQPALYNGLAAGQRAANVFGALGGFYIDHSINGVLWGMTIAEVLLIAAALRYAFTSGDWALLAPDLAAIKQSLSFSFPIMLVSVCASLMSYADRYVLLNAAGSEAVARYAVGYDLCLLLQTLLISGFRLSIMPEIVRRYTNLGEQAAAEFIAAGFRHFMWILIASGFGLAAIRYEAITILASTKYVESAGLILWILPGVLLGGVNFMFSVTFHLKKKTVRNLAVSASAMVLSLFLYLMLVPRYQAKGAAVATLITYLYLSFTTWWTARRLMRVPFDAWSLLKSAACGMLMFQCLALVGSGLDVYVALPIKIVAGIIIYTSALLLVERDARSMARRVLRHGPLAP